MIKEMTASALGTEHANVLLLFRNSSLKMHDFHVQNNKLLQ